MVGEDDVWLYRRRARVVASLATGRAPCLHPAPRACPTYRGPPQPHQALSVTDESAGTSVAKACLAFARADGRKAALTTPEGTWNRAKLARTIELLAEHIRRETSVDETVALVVGSDHWSVCAVLACELSGRTSVLLPASAADEYIMRAAKRTFASLVMQTSDPGHAGTRGNSLVAGTAVRWNHVEPDRGTVSSPETAVAGAICQQTSGSMDAPRFALRSHTAIMTEVSELTSALSLSDTDTVLCGSSIAHSYGLMGGLLAPLHAGARVLLARDSSALIRLLMRCTPTIVFSLGPAYAQLLDALSPQAPGLRRVRLAFSAGAALPDGLFERVDDRLGLQIRQDYGTTETGTISMDLAPAPAPNTVGRLLPHVEVRLRAPDVAKLHGVEVGEILVRSSAVATGYRAGPNVTRCVDAGGWFNTHDAGSWLGESLRVHRRVREPVRIHGSLVHLDAVESAIASMPDVREVAAHVRRVDSRIVLRVLVATTGRTEEDIRCWCREVLPAACVPDEIVVVEALPRSPAGKVLLKYL